MLRPRFWAYFLILFSVFALLFVITLQALKTLSGTFIISETRTEVNPETGNKTDIVYRYKVSGLKYGSGLRFGVTDKDGTFKYREGKSILFQLGKIELGATEGNPVTSHTEFFNSENIFTLLVALDDDGYRQNGIQISKKSLPTIDYSIDLSLPPDEFRTKLTKDFTQPGIFTFTTLKGDSVPVTGLEYVSGVEYGKTTDTGEFFYQQNKKVTFRVNDTAIAPLIGNSKISPESFPSPIYHNLQQYLLTLDSDHNAENGINISTLANKITVDFSLPRDAFELAFSKVLSKHGIYPARIFAPSLGLNLESAQPEADSIGQAMPFVDIFRTARPFMELSDKEITYDKQGWPTHIPEGKKAYTLLLQGLPNGAIPYGRYTVLYDGIGTLAYDGLAKRVDFAANKDIVDINPRNTASHNRMIVRINESDESNPIRNIRIIMPGGICEGVPQVRVDDESDCATGKYRPFEDMLQERNTIVFNPDYLRLLQNFKVLRMMNLMEASPHIPSTCYQFKDDDFRDCLKQPYTWSQRSHMDDAVWGGSFRTDVTRRHGVPIEVLVELANQTNRQPWFNIPHNATNEFVEEFSRYINDHLNYNLKAYVEYSNETWNSGFWAAQYMQIKGRDLELDGAKNPYREGLRYYSKRAVEIFKIWEDTFEGNEDRLVRVIGSYISSPDLSNNVLNYQNAHEHIDALAVAPYFHACMDRKHRSCKNILSIPTLLSDMTTLDDIFDALDNKRDPYAIPALIKRIQEQSEIATKYKVNLVAYEGGQHLKVNWGNKEQTKERKEKLLELFRKANYDLRMKKRYITLLEAWKKAGGSLFNVYTMPQSPHKWGAWGIKTHLNQPRSKAPKYDAILEFQEKQGDCWWDDCLIERE